MPFQNYPQLKIYLSVLIPILAALLQWQLWPIVTPKTWIFFYPAVFLSASICGFVGGTISTCLTALMGVYFFIDPQFTWVVGEANNYVSLLIFVFMGFLFSLTFDRFHRTAKELQRLRRLDQEVQENRLKQALDVVNAGIWEWIRSSMKMYGRRVYGDSMV
jgi:K+-sensing histidine kinase KdpD